MAKDNSFYKNLEGKTVRVRSMGGVYTGVVNDVDFNRIILNPYLTDYSTDLVETCCIENRDCIIAMPIQSIAEIDPSYMQKLVDDLGKVIEKKNGIEAKLKEVK